MQSGMIVWRFSLNLVVAVADGNLFDACLISASAALSNGHISVYHVVDVLYS
jgi:exosome complex RNA-binding protein Rrp42 (RNase PH superfamily)